MQLTISLSQTEIEEAIAFYLKAKGYTVTDVSFNIDPGAPGNDPREPHWPTLTEAKCTADQQRG